MSNCLIMLTMSDMTETKAAELRSMPFVTSRPSPILASVLQSAAMCSDLECASSAFLKLDWKPWASASMLLLSSCGGSPLHSTCV